MRLKVTKKLITPSVCLRLWRSTFAFHDMIDWVQNLVTVKYWLNWCKNEAKQEVKPCTESGVSRALLSGLSTGHCAVTLALRFLTLKATLFSSTWNMLNYLKTLRVLCILYFINLKWIYCVINWNNAVQNKDSTLILKWKANIHM